MSKNELIFSMSGPTNGDGRLDASVFAEKIRRFVDLLKQHSVLGDDKKKVSFKLVRLSYSSPAATTITAESTSDEFAKQALNRLQRSLDSVQDENANHLSEAVLSKLKKLAKADPKEIGMMEIQVVNEGNEKRTYQVDDRFRKTLSRARNTGEGCINTISGKLEQVNIHNNVNTCKIYPSLLGWDSVVCTFPQELLSEVQNALGRYVSVRGECFYKRDANLAHRMQVDSMEVLPNSEGLPDLQDLEGIAPNITGELSSEEFVRRQRDQWDKQP